MRKLLFLTIFGIAISLTHAQDISRTEVDLGDFFLNTGKESWSSKIHEDVVQNVFERSNSIYQFDLVYNDKVIYRGTLDKPTPKSPSVDQMATILGFKKKFVIDDKLISDDDKKLLLERHRSLTLIPKDQKGKHDSYLEAGGGWSGDYELLKSDPNSEYGYSLNHPLENLIIKLYRIDI